MANLTNKYIYETYKSIVGIGTSGTSGVIPGQVQPLTDGEGNELPIAVSDTDVEVGFLTTKNVFIEAYGEVIDQNGNWIGPSQGLSGTSGTSGTSGANGSSGVAGSSGTSGTSGQSGSSGTSGKNGTSGTSGIAGSSGTSGTSGATGATGSSGTSGTSGAAGAPGTSGTSGMNGTSGVNGTSGTSGQSGTSGTSGVSGSAGTSGTSGINGISTGRTYFFNNSENSDIAPYKVLSTDPTAVAQQVITKTLAGSEQNVLVQEFITPELGFTVIPGGVQRFHLHFLKPAQNDNIETYVTLQLANSAGVPYGPATPTNSALIGWTDSVNPVEVEIDLVITTTAILATDRVIIKIYLNNNDANTQNVNWYTEGSSNYSYVTTTVAPTTGTSGTSGTSGVNGANGSSGTSGVDGANGSSGTSGVDGANGSSGTSGANGVAGTSGTSGSSGTSGGGSSAYNPLTLQIPIATGQFGQLEKPWSTYPISSTTRTTLALTTNQSMSGITYFGTSTITDLRFYITTAATAGATAKLGIYKFEVAGTGSGTYLTPTTLVYTIATNVPIDTVGAKTISGLNFNPANYPTEQGMYCICFIPSAPVTISMYNNVATALAMYGGWDASGTLYKTQHYKLQYTSFDLPTTLTDISTRSGTEAPFFLWKQY